MKPILVCLFVAVACTTMTSRVQPQLTGSTCSLYDNESACGRHGCDWVGPIPCQCPGCGSSDPGACPPCACDPGVETYQCEQRCDPSCVIELQPGCICPQDEVCFVEVGTAPLWNGDPDIGCVLPADGQGDACARIEAHGACRPSPDVAGLCLCAGGM